MMVVRSSTLRNRGIAVIVAALAAFLTDCSEKKSIGRYEARSEIRSARSFAAESELFLDFLLQGHATGSYAAGHAAYLEKEIEQSAKELAGAIAEPGAEESVRECRIGLSQLARELSRIAPAMDDTAALKAAKARIRQIRSGLEKVRSPS